MNQWDERYAAGGFYYYGTEPNDFLRGQAGKIRAGGRVLGIAEGEGRNAVYLAGLGYDVTAMDQSAVGLDKARTLAERRGVSIDTVVGDLSTWDFAPGAWDAIVSIWCHLPPSLRADVYRRAVAGLEFEIAAEIEREVHEGRGHHGPSAVVQILARRPLAAATTRPR